MARFLSFASTENWTLNPLFVANGFSRPLEGICLAGIRPVILAYCPSFVGHERRGKYHLGSMSRATSIACNLHSATGVKEKEMWTFHVSPFRLDLCRRFE